MNESVRGAIDTVFSGGDIHRGTALRLAGAPAEDLIAGAGELRRAFFGDTVSLCAIVSARAGLCGEDCAFCAQSARHDTGAPVHPMLPAAEIAGRAAAATRTGASRFGIVTSGRGPGEAEIEAACGAARLIVRAGALSPCASLGAVSLPAAARLKAAGIGHYHHNLETSARFFPSVCTTHRRDERERTVRTAAAAGLGICAGGIFGIGEGWEDRVDLALDLRRLGACSVPVNFLMPVRGTPLAGTPALPPEEALRIVALFRFLLPRAEIRLAGGRQAVLGRMQERAFAAGASGMMIGDYLTMRGGAPEDDLRMLERLGLEVEGRG
ncbi:MAG: biotin synthase BioB [bacterium]|nr:biotin synthase BioB [bacterium]